MNADFGWLSVGNIAFTVLGYPMSWIELVGTVLYLWSVWLIAKKDMLTWPVGIASVILYGFLFYQIQLYADTLEQGYYLLASLYGWWFWARSGPGSGTASGIRFSASGILLGTAVATLLLSWGLSGVIARLHLIFPTVITVPASFPFLDSLTTVMSFTAMFLLARKRAESWVYWIVVDAIGVWLYFVKDVKFLSLLYVVLLGMAVKGLAEWSGKPSSPLEGAGETL